MFSRILASYSASGKEPFTACVNRALRPAHAQCAVCALLGLWLCLLAVCVCRAHSRIAVSLDISVDST